MRVNTRDFTVYNNDPVFCTPYFGPDFFKVPDPRKISGRPDKLDNRVQIDWSSALTHAN